MLPRGYMRRLEFPMNMLDIVLYLFLLLMFMSGFSIMVCAISALIEGDEQ